jgi:hypothetical protein
MGHGPLLSSGDGWDFDPTLSLMPGFEQTALCVGYEGLINRSYSWRTTM